MKNQYGRKKAGSIPARKTVFMIVSIIAVSLFVGMAMQPAMCSTTTKEDLGVSLFEVDSSSCGCSERITEKPKCDTCVKAVLHAVEYMKIHVRTELKDKGVYFLKTADAAILVFEGLVLGFLDSGFKIKIDYKELSSVIDFWVAKLWGPQMYFITRFMAKLGAISIGITWYLLSLCVIPSE